MSTTSQSILPFSLFTNALPAPNSISSNTTTIKPVPHGAADLPINNLLFFHEKRMKAGLGEDFILRTPALRRALHPEFEGHFGDKYCALQQEGLKLMNAFALDAEKGEATFWMDHNVMDEVQRNKEWHVGMWRTDIWDNVSWPWPVGMKGIIRKGSRWFG